MVSQPPGSCAAWFAHTIRFACGHEPRFVRVYVLDCGLGRIVAHALTAWMGPALTPPLVQGCCLKAGILPELQSIQLIIQLKTTGTVSTGR